jgi:hypothetical protein
MKDYLTEENKRNKDNADLYVLMLRLAFEKEGTEQVLVGHHITFEFDGKIDTMNEIPSADTLLFDHDIMTRIFGDSAIMVMKTLAALPACDRERSCRRAIERFRTTAQTVV